MAHEISTASGKPEFAYAGETPWHSLGTRLQNVATSSEMLEAAGLGWFVQSEPLFRHNPDGTYSEVEGWVANARSDSRDLLGVVSTEYQPVQNGDAFRFLDSLVGEAAAMYHTAGAVRKGRLVFALVKLPRTLVVVGDDVVDQYLLLVNGHDGSSALHLRFTPIRVVCMNTLSAALNLNRSRRSNALSALGGASHQISIRHTGNLQGRIEEARRALGIATRYFEIAGQTYKALSARQISAMELKGFTEAFWPVPTAPAEGEARETLAREQERAKTIHERIAFLFENGRGNTLPGVKGSAWAALNAATEFIDHVRTAKQDGTFRKAGPEAAMFGYGEVLRQKAMDAALALIS